ncbi:VOC family protein [Paenibacillus chitinolyticus]|uniref:VOC family protein n=1 Tax=Paenibacillus chitinolyticus TaxID=79263 RepID=UPI003630C92F
MITSLHHAQITIGKSDEERARQFYCGLLGLQEIDKPAELAGRGGFWLLAGATQIHVGTESGVDRAATKAHLAYEVTDIEEARSRLRGAGIEPLPSVAIPGYERFECRDPFGNRIEFIRRTES